jgi:glycosyltransferase involved in cell wall biosynthesis
MRLLIATDAFPPVCGGSGWSTYELARGLRARGHHVRVLQPQRDGGVQPPIYDGFEVIPFAAPAPPVPFVRNYFRNERLYARLGRFLADLVRQEGLDLVHGQHLLTGPASIRAGHIAGVPSVCTIRDYWPICYWSDLLQDVGAGALCPACSAANMVTCVRSHAGFAWPLAVPWIPYMQANLRTKQHDLAQATAIVAVSHSVADDLTMRASGVPKARIHVIPNGVDVERSRSAAGSTRPLDEPYALFVGKLAHNKGVGSLIEVLKAARLRMPLVVVGDGPEREWLARAAAAAGVNVRMVGWQDRDAVFRWMAHSCLMIFPSGWREPLSRVLIEAAALGVPVAALDTGGTPDIVLDGTTGLLARTVPELADAVARLAADEDLRTRLSASAAVRAAAEFDLPVVVNRMEQLYGDLRTAADPRGRRV